VTTTKQAGYIPLRSHIVQRVPTRAELLRRPPIVITDRDRAILSAVFDLGFLTTEHVVRAFFPEEGTRRTSPVSSAYERLRLLWLWSLLDRIELPVARVLGGRRSFLYTLGSHGIPYIAGRHLATVRAVRRRRLDRFDDRFVEHDGIVATFWADLVAGLRDGPTTLDRWIPEREIRTWKLRIDDPMGGPWLPVLPDGIGLVSRPDGTQVAIYLEVDLGTATLDHIARKVRAAEWAFLRWRLQERLGDVTLLVVVVTTSWKRLVNIWKVAQPEVQVERRQFYRFGTIEDLESRGAWGAEWTDLNDQRAILLRRAAWE
jgi:Replication-relaxation